MLIKLATAALMAIFLAGCGDTLAMLDAPEFFTNLAEKGEAMTDDAIQKAADGYDLYCNKVPRTVQERMNARFNEATAEHDMPKWCPVEPAPLPE